MLRLEPDGGALPPYSIPLIGADGAPLGGLAWSLEEPGRRVFDKALMMILLATPEMIGLGWAFVRRARDTVMIVLERERAVNLERVV